ncbi:MAG: carboxymethylenebutenolidase [Cyanobacteria bacterium QS_7_48_42]|nr:MAG: carboxymethylenebutenolidase [Cyanobacteria bacterium QH_10_48_56]PSO62461.1 MAG: carboxymethylenebutenolidase [Cyanobacteria bacterium QH_7_48_89]PSO64006.1 MAG: carboxymethylenebutenolidase [Cyanobacteria bacterium QH_6_48_35]PSO73886.1 MAG: carboxymethylenebutenolidase [Cyanobacteria bacterium QH_3_48_40]PSO74918.1 MAG: carboxymethylenebutenolidase [Cyanobacteria bacterium QS_1_48_34]PSO76631.1 MAG: carboxymethylenebutenolidase [Cyanobacteria bacterium QS_4_48_99]PSO79142.1 MAG: ca
MPALDIQTDQVKVDGGDVQIDSYLATPTEAGSFPGVVVIQEVFGVNDHIRDVTRRIAREGYVAVAPAIYQRQAPGFEVGYSEEELELGRKYKNQTKASELLNDIQAAINYLKNQPQVKQDGVGCIGFCFGGHVAYLAATLPDTKATATLYGAGIATNTPGGGEPTINLTPKIKGTIYAFFGTEDPLIPQEDVEQIEAALLEHEIPHMVFRYRGASHGFFCDQRASYNQAAAEDAWEKVKQLFSKELK